MALLPPAGPVISDDDEGIAFDGFDG